MLGSTVLTRLEYDDVVFKTKPGRQGKEKHRAKNGTVVRVVNDEPWNVERVLVESRDCLRTIYRRLGDKKESYPALADALLLHLA